MSTLTEVTEPVLEENTLVMEDEFKRLQEVNELLLEQERRKGLDDLYYLNKYLLNYKDMSARSHKPVCRLLSEKGKRKKLIQLPRGFFKSSLVTIGYTIQSIAKNPDIRILIDNETYGNSRSFLREIKGHLDSPRVLELYPQVETNKRISDGATESTVIVMGRNRVLKEPTISCAGIDQVKIGMHYDLIIMDDLVSNRNVTTKEQMEKVIEHYKLALSLLEPDGELIIIGTRYHYSDLYGYLMEREPENFEMMILPAILDEDAVRYINLRFPDLPYLYEIGSLLFPERLDEAFLEEQRRAQGTYLFNCQYMLDPVSREDAEFQREWIRYYRGSLEELRTGGVDLIVEWVGDSDKKPLPDFVVPFRVPVSIYSLWDPAHTKKKGSDNTGGATIGVTPTSDWFILNLIRDKFNPKEIVNRIFSEADRYKPILVGVEENGKESIKTYLLDRMRQAGAFFRLRELKTGSVPKEDRIRRLIPRWENGTIFMPISIKRKTWDGRVIDAVEVLENEFMYFPKAKSDDLMDTLAHLDPLLYKGTNKGSGKRKKGRSQIVA